MFRENEVVMCSSRHVHALVAYMLWNTWGSAYGLYQRTQSDQVRWIMVLRA